MVRYAEVSCSRCHAIHPGNEMKTVKDRVVVGETFRSDARGLHSSGGGSVQYGFQKSILCPSCLRRRSFIRGLILSAVAAVGFFFFSPRHATSTSASPNPEPKSVSTDMDVQGLGDEGGGLNVIDPQAFDGVTEGDEESAQPSSEENEIAPDTVEAPSDEQPNVGGGAGVPLVFEPSKSSELSAAMLQAASTGSPQRWTSNGVDGWANPSSTTDDAGCRNVSYTMDSNKGWQSDPKRVCP